MQPAPATDLELRVGPLLVHEQLRQLYATWNIRGGASRMHQRLLHSMTQRVD